VETGTSRINCEQTYPTHPVPKLTSNVWWACQVFHTLHSIRAALAWRASWWLSVITNLILVLHFFLQQLLLSVTEYPKDNCYATPMPGTSVASKNKCFIINPNH